ncbi:hypothetical protein TrLO_g12754 [Triparma laevis f. longispina]|uniref:RING-type domain-containing protein n=1 Tax=Triparma laevis f. longispina TaxID=1714387 RepID=A0A9W7A6F4_9STRA|nr:hypothetical protein TrLO_g12754 [Triparma laevis f. longispina]
MCPCGHSAVCRDCTRELMTQSQLCPICRKPMVGFDVGVYSGSLGERGLWPTSARHFRELGVGGAVLCGVFDDKSLLVVAWRRILEVLELAMPEEKKVRGKKKNQRKKKDPKKLEVLDACLALVYDDLKNYKKALEYYKRALEGKERTLRKTHSETLMAVMNTGTTYLKLRDLGKAEELYQRALKGYEAQLGKDHVSTINCA